MKIKTNYFIICIFTLCLCAFTNIQSVNAQTKENKKELKGDIKEKATKQARRESKKMQKDGYMVTAGAIPMEKQLDLAWMKQYEMDDLGFPKYFISNAKTIGGNYSAAKMQAVNLAKVELAGLISSQIASLAENSVANQDLSNQEAASLVKTVEASKTIISQELGRIMMIFEIYKELPNKNIEVQVRIAYNVEMAMDAAKKIIVKKLESETNIAHEKLEKLMGIDNLKSVKKNSNVSSEE
ncbi:MAG: hypothetical protein ACOYMA_14460 [Bacteroidia bacterium]